MTDGYYCDICNTNIELFNKDLKFSWDMHQQNDTHRKTNKKIRNGKKNRSNEINEQNMHDNFKTTNAILKFAKELEERANLQLLRTDMHNEVKNDISEFFRNIYNGHFKIVQYGSRITGLTAKVDSDLDFYLDTNENVVPIDNHELENFYLKKAEAYIEENCNDKWTNARAILAARTPILTLYHRNIGLFCDITILNGFGMYNTKLLRLYMANIPFMRQLILLIREWSVMYDFQKVINNYAFSLLVLFYLQQMGYAPSVDTLSYECQVPAQIIGGYTCVDYDQVNYNRIKKTLPNDKNVKHYFEEFFKYYSEFNFMDMVICPLLGRTICKALFKNRGKKLPSEMENYKLRLKNVITAKEFDLNKDGLKVQDPIDLEHNITKDMSQTNTKDFANCCTEMYKLLKKM